MPRLSALTEHTFGEFSEEEILRQPTVKPEATELPGAPDHDGDSDDGAVQVTLSKQS